MHASKEQIAERLRRCGLRATGSRVAVYAAVESLDGHPDVKEILARVHVAGDSVSTPRSSRRASRRPTWCRGSASAPTRC